MCWMKAPASVRASYPFGAAFYQNDSLDENFARAKEGGKEKTGEASSLSPSHGPLRFVTSLSRFALASAKNGKTKRLAAFGGYLEKLLEKESLFAGWMKAILDFSVFWGVHPRELEV